MGKEALNFTSIGIVKCDKFEVSQNDFFNKMSRFITNDYNRYSVNYYPDEDYYEVVYNYRSYYVKDGKNYINSKSEKEDIVYYLNQLVALTKFQKKLNKEISKIKEEKTEDYFEMQKKANLGISDTIEEMNWQIKGIKNEDKENKTNTVETTKDIMKKMNYGEMVAYHIFRIMGGVIGLVLVILNLCGLLGATGFWFYFFMGLLIFDPICLASCKFDWMGDPTGYRGPFASIFSVLSSPFVLGYLGIKRLFEIIKLEYKLNPIKREIKKLKRKNGYKKSDGLKAVKDIKALLDDTEDKNKVNSNNLITSFSEFSELKDRILNISDEKVKSLYANELYGLLDCFVKYANSNSINKKSAYSKLFSQLACLKNKVDNELKEENQVESDNRIYYKLMNEIKEKKDEPIEEEGFQKRIGVRQI